LTGDIRSGGRSEQDVYAQLLINNGETAFVLCHVFSDKAFSPPLPASLKNY
jgi:hypothetical protein